MNNKHLFLIALVALSSTATYAGVYKWTDEDGKTHYSQSRPEAGITSESLRLHGRKPQDSSKEYALDPDKKETASKEVEPKKDEQQAAEQKNDEPKLSAKQSKAACLSARKNLAQMKSSGRVRQKDAKGNISYLSDKQKQDQMKQAQKIIKKFCK